MEGVGARLGRSSTRYGPATVFTGPVRKWKKKWIHVTPPNTAATSNDKHHHQQQHQSNGNSTSNGNNNNNNNASHILLYKWTPISQSQNNDNSNGDANDDGDAARVEEDPPRRKMKYIPIAVLEEQNNEEAKVQTDETNPNAPAETSSNSEKPDINDVPKEDNQVSENINVERQDLNKSTVGLSLNLNDRDGDDNDEEESEDVKDQSNDDRMDRVSE